MNDIDQLQFEVKYATTYGFTEEELVDSNSPLGRLIEYAKKEKASDIMEKLKKSHNGFAFAYDRPEITVYNPITVFSYLRHGKFVE